MTRRPIFLASFVLLVTACASPVTPSAATGSSSPQVATAPVPTATPQASASVASNALRLLVLGDSIAIPEMGCGSCEGFDQQYATYLETLTGRPVTLQNEARPNAQIEDLQALLDTDRAVQEAVAQADIVVVSIGYNDTPPWAPDRPCHTAESLKDADIWPAILSMTQECIDATVAIYADLLDTVYGRIEELAGNRPQVRINLGSFDNIRDNPGGDGTITDVEPDVMAAAYIVFQSAMDAWNKADCEAATGHGFVCGDIHHAFNGPDGTKSIKGLVNPADFVHPSVAGQAVIAELLERVDVSSLAGN